MQTNSRGHPNQYKLFVVFRDDAQGDLHNRCSINCRDLFSVLILCSNGFPLALTVVYTYFLQHVEPSEQNILRRWPFINIAHYNTINKIK